MGTPGVPLDISKETILTAIKKHKGVGARICKELSICHTTFLRHVRDDSDLDKALLNARHSRDEELCDLAEDVLVYSMSQRDDLPSAISSAKFSLNNKGKSRGYAPIVHGVPISDPRLDTIDGNSTDLVNESKA